MVFACPAEPEAEPAATGLPPATGATGRIAATLQLLERCLPVRRRLLHAGEPVYRAGQAFTQLHVVNSGCYKLVNSAADGREQVVALKFRGDWLGFDGIARGTHICDTIALDTGEVWSIGYAALLDACADEPQLLQLLHTAISRQMVRDRAWQMTLCSLRADARVAEFLRHWTEAHAELGLRTDRITLRMSRAEIGSLLGLTLESVSRALTRLEREALIRFGGQGRREVQIPDTSALGAFVERCAAPRKECLQ